MGSEDDTPPRGVILDSDSRDLADLFFALNGAANRIGEAARVVADLRGAERAAFLAAIADRLGELGDICHEGRREMKRRSMETAK